jgi:hypothetical protein
MYALWLKTKEIRGMWGLAGMGFFLGLERNARILFVNIGGN